MDVISDPLVETVVVLSSSQVGKTEIINNIVGFHIDQDPAPIIVIQPTLEMGEAWSKDRLAPMLRDTPCLRGRVKDARSRDSGNTLLHKIFPGGHITIAGANSPASLASRPIRIALFDEVDRYPISVGTEGDPVNLGKKRTTTFWNRKIVLTSTPTIAGLSRIESAYAESDQRHFFVPCPDCGEFQDLKWAQVKWTEGNADSAFYVCQFCGSCWDDVTRWRAVGKGHWRATAEFKGVAGFHINELYSPWVSLRKIVSEFLSAKNHPEQLKTWVNTSLGETWQEKGEAPEWRRLYDRREDYKPGTIPRGGLLLDAGADVQKDRIEVEVVAWGRAKESWSVDYLVIEGDPSRPEVWLKLDQVMNMRFRMDGGSEAIINRLAIDSGYATQDVYAWARKYRGTGRVMVVKGVDRSAVPVGQPTAVDVNHGGKKITRGIKIWPVASGILKSEFYGWLRLERPTEESGQPFPPGYCHFPKYQEEYFKQLTAEQLVTKTVKGYQKLEWQKTRERNESLDARVYARAAAISIGIDRWNERQWRELEGRMNNSPTADPKLKQTEPQPRPGPVKEEPAAAQPRPPRIARRGGWLGNRGGWLKK